MKTVTNEFKEQIAKLGREIDFKFFLHTNDKILTEDGKFLMTENNLHLVVEQFDEEEVDEIITGDDIFNVAIVNKGKILSTMMKEVDFEVRQDLRIGDVIDCQFGLKVGNDYEYVDYGRYMIYSKEFNEDTKTYNYVAFDKMLLTMQEASPEFLTDLEGRTLANCINLICGRVGLSFNATQEQLAEYPNLNKQINEGTFTDLQITYRDVLDMIAQALGLSMIVDGKDLKLKRLENDEIDDTITGNNILTAPNAKQENVLGYTVDGVTVQDGTPTPSSPVEIETIPSIRNLFDKSSNYVYTNTPDTWTITELDTGLRLKTSFTSGSPFVGYIIGDLSNYVGKTVRAKINFSISGNRKARIRLMLCNADGSNRTMKIDTSTSGDTISFTVPTLSGEQKYLMLALNSNTQTGASADDYIDYTNMMLTIDNVNMDYIPYGAYARVKVIGKNLFNQNNIVNGYGLYSDNGGTYANANRSYLDYTLVKSSTTYTLSNIDRKAIQLLDVNKNFISGINEATFTTPNNCRYIRISFDNTKPYQEAQLEEGSVTNYEPYKENNVLIDLEDNELCKIGDYKDTLSINDSGQVVINKNIGKYIFNGTENWNVLSRNNINNFQAGFKSHSYTSTNVFYKSISSHFKYEEVNLPQDNNFVTVASGDKVYCRLSKDNSSDVNTFKTWLASNNLTTYYVLETPETITLSNTTLPLFEGINHITFVDDLETNTSITYKRISSTIEEINENYLKDTNVSFGEKYGPVNSVVLSRSEDNDNIYRRDEESIAENGLCEFKIKDNLIMLYDDREDYIDEIFEELNGLEYYINDFNSTGITYFDWLDFYNVTVGDKTYKCLMLNDEIKIQQGLEETVYTEEPEETVTDYKTSSKTDKEVSFIVDKQNGSIRAKVNKGDVINEINLDETGASINADKISLAGKTIEMTSDNIAINSTNFKVDKDGNMTANSGTFSGSINTAQNCTVGNNLYVGQNQSSSGTDVKYIKMSDITNLKRTRNTQYNYDELEIDSTNIRINAGTIGDHGRGTVFYSDGYYTEIHNYFGNGQYIALDSGYIHSSSDVIPDSDERLKQNIEDLDISFIDDLKVKKYQYKRSPNFEQIGLVAQDYIDKDYSKYFVVKHQDGYYGINYNNINSALIQYCQEMKKEINSLKEEIAKLKESDK